MSQDARAVAQQILQDCREAGAPMVTPMQLLKLVYIAQGYMLQRTGQPLIREPIEAWQYGPVVRSLYQAIRDFGASPVTHVPFAPNTTFTTEELSAMSDVARIYGSADAVTLSSATHQPGTPWSVTWATRGMNSVIPNEDIRNFYNHILSLPSHSML